MSNEIVKFSNQFNAQALRKFTALDLDLLMAICSRMREKGEGEVTLSFTELRNLAGLRAYRLSDRDLVPRIAEVNKRLLALNFEFTNEEQDIIQFALFSTFVTSPRRRTLTVAVNPRFTFLLNDLTSQFTRFELAEFTDLKSSYAKETYRRLKQFRQTGVWKVSLAEFRRLLDVPTSYTISNLNSRVLKPIQDELGKPLGLKIHKKFEKRSRRGRSSLVGLEFEFRPETVRGGASAPRIDLSAGVRLAAAKKSLEDAKPRRFDVSGWGEVWWCRAAFDVGVARDHLTGAIDSADCPVCDFDARNQEHHGERGELLEQGWGEVSLF